MNTPTTRGRRAASRTLRSPLAAPGGTAPASASVPAARSSLTDRESTLTAAGFESDFTAVDTPLLNRYFREYYLAHGQGGTHTLQRNLLQLFNFLEKERGFATPYTDGLNRYAAVKGRPKTLSSEFVDDLLESTGNGQARDFETARDHAIIRILRSEDIRRAELLGMVMSTLPADVIKNPVFRLVPLKGHGPRARGAWRSLPRPAPARCRSTCEPAATTRSPTPTGSGSGRTSGEGSRTRASGRC